MAFDLQSGYGLGAGADELRTQLRDLFAQALARQKMAEEIRQANMQNQIAQGQLGVSRDRLGLDTQKLAEDQRQFNEQAPLRIANVKHLGAETDSLNRAPDEAQKTRDFTTQRDATQHGYRVDETNVEGKNRLREIGAQGANALRIAQINNQTREDIAGKKQATQDANEVADTISLIDQIQKDPSLSHAVGPVDQYAGGVVNMDPSGVNRFRALHNELVGKLSLAQAGKLRGQGQISDKERALLSQAATALNQGLSEKDYLAELGKIRQQFVRMQAGTTAPAAAQEYDYVPGKGLVPRVPK